MDDLLQVSDAGIYCPAGGFHIDPTRPVPWAVITHAHSDHARWGCRHYLAARPGEQLLRMRLGDDADFQFADYGEVTYVGGVRVSFHPAGHILGSAQVRLEHRGRVAVVTGDYKLGEAPTCRPWEPVACQLLVTESTFALPVYRWQRQAAVTDAINDWWRTARDTGTCCILYGYSVGKSQRLLAGLDPSIGPIYTHGAVEKGTDAYRRTGVQLPPTTPVASISGKHVWRGGLVLAPPSAHGTAWMRRFGPVRTAMASGWMAIRGTRRRRNVDRGFVLSDHVDWPSLLEAVKLSAPEEIWVTHGYAAAAARYFSERGYDAKAISNRVRRAEDDWAVSESAG